MPEGEIIMMKIRPLATLQTVAKLWKNGTPQVLADGSNSAHANLVFVDDGQMDVQNFTETPNNITAFPNPVLDVLHLKTKTEIIQKVELFSITEKSLKTWEGQSEIDLSQSNSGNYFVKIRMGDNRTVTKQIIKK